MLPLQAKTVELTAPDNHTAICLALGDTLKITLPSMVLQSYRWQSHLPTSSPLTALNSEYKPPANPKLDSATQIFRFNAARVGKFTLQLNFERQEPGAAPQTTSTFSVEVDVASGEPIAAKPGEGPAVLIGVYKGKLPCADCGGLDTELRLYAKGKFDITDTFYIESRTYLATRNGDQTYTDRGEWAVLKGDAVDPNATVYQLDPGTPDRSQYLLLQQQGAALTQLDRELLPIHSPMNLTLRRVP